MPTSPTQVKSELIKMKEKEKQSYVALSALIDLLQGEQRHVHEPKPADDFDSYKRATLIRATRLNLNDTSNKTSPASENQFNVMHYKRAILSASQPNYRNMAILAAKHNLTPQLMVKLLNLVKKSCIKLSKEGKLIERKLMQIEAKPHQETGSNAHAAVILANQLETAV